MKQKNKIIPGSFGTEHAMAIGQGLSVGLTGNRMARFFQPAYDERCP